MKFPEAYEKFRQDIALTARGQSIVGMDYDDVVAEMTVMLWKACSTWSPSHGVPFGSYWWSLWCNRRTDLIREAGRQKRPPTVLIPDPVVDKTYEVRPFPEAPTGTSGLEALIWKMLGHGEPVTDILKTLRISRRSYYRTIMGWRTEEVRQGLIDT